MRENSASAANRLIDTSGAPASRTYQGFPDEQLDARSP
jgi:hypothetical protein